MAVRKLEHVGIMVRNMEKSIQFYTEVVGLVHLYTMTHTNGVIRLGFLAGKESGETELELVEGYNGELPAEGRVHHVAFSVDDVEAEFARIKSLPDVVVRDTEITTLPNGARYFFFEGPDGEFLEMFQPAAK
ncbi:lactoylglutathione lyase [Paenibacillus phyllosphaerae]|uniref:Lactoylglutathione lyase n=1 Tax=Paenibacillus phyllosphaerae TaxID=274593 RepID=A0A7W5AU70_9BACL|nr:VOC family protein [Paenibacillus phyllosphaerae]MBB3108707.1 lactoylglutathione lyase [Paenibacillus phyllosphaerae]